LTVGGDSARIIIGCTRDKTGAQHFPQARFARADHGALIHGGFTSFQGLPLSNAGLPDSKLGLASR
jgi:hypothetical protein